MEKRKRGQYGKREDPMLGLTEKLAGKVKTTGITVGRAMGACDNTGRARLNNPETFTIAELRRVCRAYGITNDELFKIIKIGV